MNIKIFGVKTYISVPFAILMAFLLVTDSTGFMGISLFAVAVHELAHLLAMKLLKCAPNSIELGIGGVLIRSKAYASFKENLITVLSGPLVNLFFAGLFWALGYGFELEFFYLNSVVQFVVGGVNLLPVKGLDGGKVMRIILESIGVKYIGLTCSVVSIFTACAITIGGLAVLVKNVSNPSLLLLGIYLIIINVSRFNCCYD